MKLTELNKNQSAEISLIEDSDVSLKLFEFGLLPGAIITIVNKAPFNGPIYIAVNNALISLRKAEADTIIL